MMAPVSKPAAHHHHHRKAAKGPAAARRRLPDGAVYIGILMIGVFALALWYIVSEETVRHGLVGYVIAVAILVNLYTWRACTGRSLAAWQRSLARLPLRFAGYGSRGGKPLEAAKGSPRARMMLFMTIACSAIVIVGATLLLIR